MSIYDKSGDALASAFSYAGSSLDSAYNKAGEAVFPDGVPLKVMTYNVQWFTGINSQQTMQDIIINGNDADIIGLQEISKNGTIPSVGSTVLSSYPYKQLSNHKNYNAFASKTQLANVVISDFENQDPDEESRYGETRAYMIADISVGERTVKWINTHLCVLSAEVRHLQFAELLDIADGFIESNYPVILTGDFNSSDSLSDSGSDYLNMFKVAKDKGYRLVNCTPDRGFTKTQSSLTTATSLDDLMRALDNIIVSPDVEIKSVKFDTTKFSYLDGSAIDHIPVIAELVIGGA